MAVLALVAFALYAWMQASPWPSAMVLRAAFETGGAHTSAALGKHVPRNVEATFDLPYLPGDRDARLDVFRPRGAHAPLTTIVWIHGGGFVAGDKGEIANYARIVAGKGYAVVVIDYTLAPRGHYPTPVVQGNRALAWVSANAARFGFDRDRIVVAGDSAGAQLAAQLANLVTSPAYARLVGIAPGIGTDQLLGAILFCGPYDANLSKPADGQPTWFMQTVMWSYMGRKDFWNAPGIDGFSVARHVTPAFPPTFLSVGNDDPLRIHSYALDAALRRQQVRTDTLFWTPGHQPALPHEYQFDLDKAEGKEALRRLLAYLHAL